MAPAYRRTTARDYDQWSMTRALEAEIGGCWRAMQDHRKSAKAMPDGSVRTMYRQLALGYKSTLQSLLYIRREGLS